MKIHGIEANPSVEQALQTISDPPKKVLKTKISSKEMREQWERKQKFAGPDAKKGEMRSMQAIREEFKKNGARNLNKWELLQMRKDEALRMQHERYSLGWSKVRWEHYLKDHGGKTPREVKGQGVYAGRRPKESDPTDRRDPWYLAQPEYHFDITVGRKAVGLGGAPQGGAASGQTQNGYLREAPRRRSRRAPRSWRRIRRRRRSKRPRRRRKGCKNWPTVTCA